MQTSSEAKTNTKRKSLKLKTLTGENNQNENRQAKPVGIRKTRHPKFATSINIGMDLLFPLLRYFCHKNGRVFFIVMPTPLISVILVPMEGGLGIRETSQESQAIRQRCSIISGTTILAIKTTERGDIYREKVTFYVAVI